MKLRMALAAMAFACASIAAAQSPRWVATWASSQFQPEPQNQLPPDDLTDATLRQVVRVSLDGEQVRVRLTNAAGTQPLAIDRATLARSADPASSRIDPATLRPLRFGGAEGTVIPAGADVWSDPIALALPAGADVAISIHFPKAPDRQTGHPGARATSHVVRGNHVADASLEGAKTVTRWFQIAGIEVERGGGSALVVFGDSITDGYGVQPDTNKRWTDALALRMRANPGTANMAVLNAGIGGNRLLLDGLGPNALARFDREVLTPPGVSHVLILEGINDLGTLTRDAPATREQHAALVRQMIEALRQMVARARAHKIVAIGGTIMPDGASTYYHPDAANEADRQAVNAWIRTPGNFDAVVDFDAAMRDPADTTKLRKDLDSGDGLHPSIAGYQAMADAVPLTVFGPAKPAPAPEIAMTFDDLPAHGPLPAGETRQEIAARIIAALKQAGAPATGFINAAKLQDEPGTDSVLEAWRAAGLPLGNHGWSHANLDSLTAAQFEEELTRNEPVLTKLMKGRDWKWFRYPFLAEGSTPERRSAARQVLARLGYKIASVTMDFSDWAFNGPYARCVERKDANGIARLESLYLQAAEAAIARYRSVSSALYGRDVPYVLLMHLGGLDARVLPQLLDLYKRHGFRFVTLEAAERDPVYRSEVNPALPSPHALNGEPAAKGIPVPPGMRLDELDTICR